MAQLRDCSTLLFHDAMKLLLNFWTGYSKDNCYMTKRRIDIRFFLVLFRSWLSVQERIHNDSNRCFVWKPSTPGSQQRAGDSQLTIPFIHLVARRRSLVTVVTKWIQSSTPPTVFTLLVTTTTDSCVDRCRQRIPITIRQEHGIQSFLFRNSSNILVLITTVLVVVVKGWNGMNNVTIILLQFGIVPGSSNNGMSLGTASILQEMG